MKTLTILSLLTTVLAQNLPTVDLPYGTWRASSQQNNTVGPYYVFKNIRYAAPPTFENRWREPQPPNNETEIQDGSIGGTCPQSRANVTDPPQREDCLFLDVYTPSLNTSLPVAFWIYGGSYTNGRKDLYNARGLLDQSNNSMVFVAINYRLGALGFASGSTIRENGVGNAGLYDQRFALQWVQDNIQLFGGDPSQVTVFGESAGGGSIMHQITAYNGTQQPPFQRAIVQSAGWQPFLNDTTNEQAFQSIAGLAGCQDIACLRNVSEATIINASQRFIAGQLGGAGLGVAYDGVFVVDQPGYLLKTGRFPKNLSLVLGHNSDEAELFSPSGINTSSQVDALITFLMPLAPTNITDYVLDTLYPPSSESDLYPNEEDRFQLMLAEAYFTCNTFYLADAYKNDTWNYYFNVGEGLHGSDVPYTFAQNDSRPTAVQMQDYFTNFVIRHNPNDGDGVLYWPEYGENATVLEFNTTTPMIIEDPLLSNGSRRCNFWQEYYRVNGSLQYNQTSVDVANTAQELNVSNVDSTGNGSNGGNEESSALRSTLINYLPVISTTILLSFLFV